MGSGAVTALREPLPKGSYGNKRALSVVANRRARDRVLEVNPAQPACVDERGLGPTGIVGDSANIELASHVDADVDIAGSRVGVIDQNTGWLLTAIGGGSNAKLPQSAGARVVDDKAIARDKSRAAGGDGEVQEATKGVPTTPDPSVSITPAEFAGAVTLNAVAEVKVTK